MRIDKFLWSVRKYKTRSLASEALRKDRVTVNNDRVKASREVRVGDKISFRKDSIEFSIKVLDLPKSRLGAKLVADYITDITTPEELEKQNFIGLMHKLNRAKGTGRPTKKDRRDLNDFMEGDED
ncbi:MAG: RNA-binding protein [Bacteroidetes bacterium]|nr:MAG: RNA-binding protein [Bacteroidota bacterium]